MGTLILSIFITLIGVITLLINIAVLSYLYRINKVFGLMVSRLSPPEIEMLQYLQRLGKKDDQGANADGLVIEDTDEVAKKT